MPVLLLLIAVSLSLSAAFVGICIVSIRNGQFDDLESPRWRLLFTDSGDGPAPAPIPDFAPDHGFRLETQSRIATHDPH
jgi:cbb3-type cytochrome oxidase maturation protein